MARTVELGRLRSAPHQPISSGRGQPRTCMPKKRGTRSGLWREFREVRAAALHKLCGSKIGLSTYELQVPAQQIRADLDRIDGDGTGTAASSHNAGTTANGCHDGHGQVARAGNPTERSTAGKDEENLDGTQYEEIEVGSGPVRVAGPKDPPQGATLRRASDVMENLWVRMESLPHRTGQEVSRAPGENRSRMFATATWTPRTRN